MVRPKTVPNPLLLRVFGVPNLVCCEGATSARVIQLRRKDLALLIYLCIEGKRAHSRSSLASLLWGDASDENARHSLSQALARLKTALAGEYLDWSAESVEWRGGLQMDAAALDRDDPESATRLPSLEFLSDFCIGRGGAEFEIWAEGRRSHYRAVALRLLGVLGDEAESGAAWERALSVGQREVALEPIHEEGHRRIMRAWSSMGERGLALQHYRRFGQWLETELDAEPEIETQELAEALRESTQTESTETVLAGWVDGSAGPAFSGVAADYVSQVAARERARGSLYRRNQPKVFAFSLWVGVGVLLLTFALPVRWLDADQLGVVPREGRPFIAVTEDLPAALHNGTLSVFPDWQTADACLGGRQGVIGRADRAPDVPARRIPSILDHPWLAGRLLVRADSDPTVFALVGCVKSPVAEGSAAAASVLSPILTVPAELLDRLPTGAPLQTPVRPAGTVIRMMDRAEMRWVVFGGGALSVRSPRVLASHCKSVVVEVDPLEFASYTVVGRLRASNQVCAQRSDP